MYYFGNIGVSNILKKGLMKTVLGMLDIFSRCSRKASRLLNDTKILENYVPMRRCLECFKERWNRSFPFLYFKTNFLEEQTFLE